MIKSPGNGGSITSGSVTSLSVVTANGLAGTVATATTTPAITLSTTITGLLVGNGTAIAAASASDIATLGAPNNQWQWGVPVILPGGGSMANNGAITLTTALPTIFSTGCYLYLPLNALVTGSAAGVYYAVMSSTTVGTVFNNVLAAGSRPVVIASPTAFATTGPGAYTQTVGSPLTLITLPVTAGSMGPNGTLVTDVTTLRINNADSVPFTGVLGGSQLWVIGNTSNSWEYLHRTVRNMGVATAQSAYNLTTAASSTDWQFNTQTPGFLTLNTANALNYALTAQITTSATNYAVILGGSLQVNYAA